jgi:hypothetical protein
VGLKCTDEECAPQEGERGIGLQGVGQRLHSLVSDRRAVQALGRVGGE